MRRIDKHFPKHMKIAPREATSINPAAPLTLEEITELEEILDDYCPDVKELMRERHGIYDISKLSREKYNTWKELILKVKKTRHG